MARIPGLPEHLPIIDLSSDDENATAKQLLKAAAECGFAYVRGVELPIDATQLNGIFALVKPPSPHSLCRHVRH